MISSGRADAGRESYTVHKGDAIFPRIDVKKELEYLEKICENVGNITVDGSKALLSQLGNVLTDVR